MAREFSAAVLETLLARVVQPWTDARHDRLFTPFAPNGAPARVLQRLYQEYAPALPGESVPPQHKHFRGQVQRLLGRDADLALLHDATLKSVYALYAACFERSETFNFQLAQCRGDPLLRQTLLETRSQVIADLLELERAEQQRRAHYSRWYEWRAAETDIEGAMLFESITRMSPDDWHEIVLRWNWDAGVREIDWITSQQSCDRATALFALCSLKPGLVATTLDQGAHRAFVRVLAARLENGRFPNAELDLALPMRTRLAFTQELEAARATGESPWRLETELLVHRGRPHAPKYTLDGGKLRFHYDYWLTHVAPRHKR